MQKPIQKLGGLHHAENFDCGRRSAHSPLVCDFLRREGYEPLEAEDGEQALSVFHAHPDTALMLLDVMMPKRDGWEVCRAVRETSNMPILMLTARSEEFDELMALRPVLTTM